MFQRLLPHRQVENSPARQRIISNFWLACTLFTFVLPTAHRWPYWSYSPVPILRSFHLQMPMKWCHSASLFDTTGLSKQNTFTRWWACSSLRIQVLPKFPTAEVTPVYTMLAWHMFKPGDFGGGAVWIVVRFNQCHRHQQQLQRRRCRLRRKH